MGHVDLIDRIDRIDGIEMINGNVIGLYSRYSLVGGKL